MIDHQIMDLITVPVPVMLLDLGLDHEGIEMKIEDHQVGMPGQSVSVLVSNDNAEPCLYGTST